MDMSLEDAGYNCQECKDKGCCPICRSPPCDGGMVVCSDRTCKKWYHLKCENVTDEFIATVKTYYCVACRQHNPKRKIVKFKKSEIEDILKNLKSQKSEEDIQQDQNVSPDLSSKDTETPSDLSDTDNGSDTASENQSINSSSTSENVDFSKDSSDEETSEKLLNTEISTNQPQLINGPNASTPAKLDCTKKLNYTTAKWNNPKRPSTILSGLSDDPQ